MCISIFDWKTMLYLSKMIAFIDESKAKKYLLVLSVLESRDLTSTRRFLVRTLLAGQRSVHFRAETGQIALDRFCFGFDLLEVSNHNQAVASSRFEDRIFARVEFDTGRAILG